MYTLIAQNPDDPENDSLTHPHKSLGEVWRMAKVARRLGWTWFIWRDFNDSLAGDKMAPVPLPCSIK